MQCKPGHLPYTGDAAAMRSLGRRSAAAWSALGPGMALLSPTDAADRLQDDDQAFVVERDLDLGHGTPGTDARVARALASDRIAGMFSRYLLEGGDVQSGGASTPATVALNAALTADAPEARAVHLNVDESLRVLVGAVNAAATAPLPAELGASAARAAAFWPFLARCGDAGLLDPGFVAAAEAQLEALWPAASCLGPWLRAYAAASGQQQRAAVLAAHPILALWLVRHGFPAPSVLGPALRDAADARSRGEAVCRLRRRLSSGTSPTALVALAGALLPVNSS